MASIITFAADNDLFRKRKRVYRACDECKRKRKRCTHTFGDRKTAAAAPDAQPKRLKRARHSSPRAEFGQDEARRSSKPSPTATPEVRSESPSRFLGRLNPESVLREQASTRGRRPENECGYWASPSRWKVQQPVDLGDAQLGDEGSDPVVKDALTAYLSAVHYSILPPKPHLQALVKLYFHSLQALLPIVDEREFQLRDRDGEQSVLLQQAICLVISKHDSAQLHLYLPDNSSILTPRAFGIGIYRSIRATLDARVEKDRIVLIQVLALLSLYVEGAYGAEEASISLSLAVHHAHTIGMQFGRSRSDDRSEYLHRLFWCLSSLDVINACMHGRPLLMHERDNRLENPISSKSVRYTPFGIWLQLSEALHQALCYYRPNVEQYVTGWEDNFPAFEDMAGDQAHELEPAVIATLELFYHVVAMISHRNRGIHVPSAANTPSYVRQTLSAARVTLILSEECPSNLPPLPIVPYALSLSMCVAYRTFRQTKLHTHKARARADLRTCCELLEKMRKAWWSAGAMADLGRAALKMADSVDRSANEKKSKPAEGSTAEDFQRSRLNSAVTDDQTAAAATLASRSDDPIQALQAPTATPVDNTDNLTPLSMDRAPLLATPNLDEASPDWLNFDNAFENFDTFLRSSGIEFSLENLGSFGDFGSSLEPGEG